ncbi:MAG: SDR family oxidoreductase [Acidobacteriota bacterium]|nr:SDR family oxidoreductase [Acidobacteriota bacterium]
MTKADSHARSTQRLAGKTAVITGAASGIGAATARVFAREGASVLITDRGPMDETVAAIQGFGGRVFTFAADLTEAGAAARVIEDAVAQLGRVDILVSNAGIGVPGTIDSLSEEVLDRVFAINFKAGFLLAKSAIPHMRRQGEGVILYTTAAAGHAGAPNLLSYSTSKAALINLVMTLALDHAREGIRVNAVSPGPTDTPMAAEAQRAFGIPPELIVAGLPLARVAQPEEIAEAFVYLASPAACSVTGHILQVDCGVLAGPYRPPPPPFPHA